MNNIDLSNLGGFPLEQDTLDFMQLSFAGPLGAIAKLCGDKTILYGVVNTGGNVSSGWIAYNGELILFQGGPVGADVVISSTPTSVTFEDGNVHEAYFVKIATCGAVGDFAFSDLVPLLSLQNMWKKDDIRECMKDAAYIAANFDVNGYGQNAETGWRILSKAYPNTAGKVFINYDPNDVDVTDNLATPGNYGGEKRHTLTIAEIPAHTHTQTGVDAANSGTSGSGANNGVSNTGSTGGDGSHQNLQPYYVILKLIKL